MSTDQSDSDQDVVEDDSDEEEQKNVSPDSTVRNVREIDLFRSRSNSRSTVRSSSGYILKYFDEIYIFKSRSRSRSQSPELSTRKLFIDSDEDNNDGDNNDKGQVSRVDNDSDDEDIRRPDDDGEAPRGNDFDMMMQQKKEENRRHRYSKNLNRILLLILGVKKILML